LRPADASKMAQAPTILHLKTTFLAHQIKLLSQPLQVSPAFAETQGNDNENRLRQKTIDDALDKANALLKQHNRCAFTAAGVRHVGEQIEAVYWKAGERGLDGEVSVEDWRTIGTDYRTLFSILGPVCTLLMCESRIGKEYRGASGGIR
jgi:hypothetical protein